MYLAEIIQYKYIINFVSNRSVIETFRWPTLMPF